MIYDLKENEVSPKKIFHEKFVILNINKCKIVYNNKIIPLQTEFPLNNKERYKKQLKFKLIIFGHFFNFDQRSEICELPSKFYLIKNFQSKNYRYDIYEKSIQYKLLYNLEPYGAAIFGENFAKNNKNKGFFMYNNKIFPIMQYISIKKIISKDKLKKNIEIKFLELEHIHNKSYMFHNCNTLLKIIKLNNINKVNFNKEINEDIFLDASNEDKYYELYQEETVINNNILNKNGNNNISITTYNGIIIESYYPSKINDKESFISNITKWIINVNEINYDSSSKLNYNKNDINTVTDISSIFYRCSSLESLPDISNWNTYNIKSLFGCFYGCSSLISLPDISKWNTSNVTDMISTFYGCSSLVTLPDISKWNTNNVTNIMGLFRKCSSLLSLPDIAKWKFNKLNNIESLFSKCSSLISLPDISKWNTDNINNMNNLFYDCKSLISLPDISKWNTNNVTNMEMIFSRCKSLKSLPDISKWNTKNVTNMKSLFKKCSSLISLPDISKWNTNNVTNMSEMFCNCSSLIVLPNICKININNVINMKSMFEECYSLISLPFKNELKVNNDADIDKVLNECLSLIYLPSISK